METQKNLKGLGGWLILVGIGLFATPIRLALLLATTYPPIFQSGTWDKLTSIGSDVYHPLWAPVLITEIVVNIALILTFVYLIYLFFAKHRWFPRLYIGVAVFSPIFILLDAWAGSVVVPDDEVLDPRTLKELVRALIAGAIWVPYMLVSQRVKATFVR
jgi:multisubunit Na+/H+ antiporter MnhC subunit